MPLSSWSHTGFMQAVDESPLTINEQINLSISDATKEAILEGRGCQFEVEGGIISIAFLEGLVLPSVETETGSAPNNIIVIAGPKKYGQMLVTMLKDSQCATIIERIEESPVAIVLLEIMFSIAVEFRYCDLLRRLHTISRENAECETVIKPLLLNTIKEGSVPMHELFAYSGPTSKNVSN
jgi:hypothetical protein